MRIHIIFAIFVVQYTVTLKYSLLVLSIKILIDADNLLSSVKLYILPIRDIFMHYLVNDIFFVLRGDGL